MELAQSTGRQAIIKRRTDTRTDRRLHKRVQLAARVRGLTAQGEEFEAVTIDFSAGGLLLQLNRPLSQGDSVVLYVDEIGRVEGSVARILDDVGYAIAFQAAPRKRDKIADQLTWTVNKDRLGLDEERGSVRRASGGGQVVATYNGVSIACAVIDMSIFGVALRTNGPRPMIGDIVTVGERTGTCVRYIDGGFALDFRTDQDS